MNLHLQVTSYFLFILVITSIIYGMLKGKPVKTKKVCKEFFQRLNFLSAKSNALFVSDLNQE